MAEVQHLVTHRDIDKILLVPRGRSLRFAKRGLIPAIQLPSGEYRFRISDIEAWLDGQVAGGDRS
jgi:predicted site-specific integrase-resolvase